MMWSRVGSLTCLSKLAARCACFKRLPASVLALAGFVVIVAFALAMGVSLRGSTGRTSGRDFLRHHPGTSVRVRRGREHENRFRGAEAHADPVSDIGCWCLSYRDLWLRQD